MDTPYILDRSVTRIAPDIGEYPGGIVIPVDKPYRWTSADVIRKIKYAAIRHFSKKNLKVGHAGTLDPLATGILIVCIGNATKAAESLQAKEKEYIAGISFGATTPSYDLEKDVDRLFPFSHISEDIIREAIEHFKGEQEQIAPLFSAKSVDGIRAYELARKLYRQKKAGGDTDIDTAAKERLRTYSINIPEIELLDFRPGTGSGNMEGDSPARPDIHISGSPEAGIRSASDRINIADTSALGLPHADIRIRCSKGTYIRAFARDLGEALGSGAHLDSLRRTANSPFHIGQSVSVDTVISLLS